MLVNILLLGVAVIAIIKATDWFLGSAESIGVRLGLPSFVLGVLLVGFGTSLPELATSIAAVTSDTHNITIANVIGSNLANILIIIGLSSFLLGTIAFDRDLIDLDLPLLFGSTVLFVILMSDGNLTAKDGAMLLFGFAGYVMYTLFYKEDKAYHQGLIRLIATLARHTDDQGKQKPEVSSSMFVAVPIALGSVVLLVLASKLTVDALLSIVAEVGVGVEVLTFFTIAIGTSLPELLVGYRSLRQGKGDVLLGNIIGSSIFNLLMVAGVATLINTQTIDPDLVVWSVIGLLLSTTMLVLSGVTRRIHVWEGLVFLLVYIAIAGKLIG